jgi:hypothetical protein
MEAGRIDLASIINNRILNSDELLTIIMKRRDFLKIAVLSTATTMGCQRLLKPLPNENLSSLRLSSNNTKLLSPLNPDTCFKNNVSSPMIQLMAMRALHWLEINILNFNPVKRVEIPDEKDQTALIELAILSHQLNQRKGFTNKAFLKKCFDLIEEVYHQPLFHEYLFRGDKHAFGGHLFVWTALQDRVGNKIINSHHFQRLINDNNVTSVEKIPFRVLELRYFTELAGFKHNLPSEEDIFGQTYLGRILEGPFNVVSIMEPDVYSITHTIFYLTDYGLKPSKQLSGTKKETALQIIDVLIGMTIPTLNWDLVGELILSSRCLQRHDSFWVKVAWDALMANQASNGAIAGPGCLLAEQQQASPRDTFRDFRQCYHQTLVATMAGFLGRQH